MDEQIGPGLHGFGALDEVFVFVADGDGLADGVDEVDHLGVDGVDGNGAEWNFDVARVLDRGVAERGARDRVVLADEFAPEGFEGGARGFGVGEFGREPGIEFGGLLGVTRSSSSCGWRVDLRISQPCACDGGRCRGLFIIRSRLAGGIFKNIVGGSIGRPPRNMGQFPRIDDP